MRTKLQIFNFAVMILSLAAWFYAYFLASLSGPKRITELDRNGVINVDKLREYNPKLAENVRNNVGRWVQQEERDAAVMYSYVIFAVCLINAIALHYVGPRAKTEKEKEEKGS